MTYSNINKDKAQVKGGDFVKKGVLAMIAIILIISALGNVYSQFKTIKNVEDKNAELLVKIDYLNLENKKLEQQIEYATSSAFMERKAREWLGVGASGDEWIDLPKEESGQSLYPEVNEENQISNIKKWRQLFTK
jgi:cell division protein FtsL